jgi:hypothetical protein
MTESQSRTTRTGPLYYIGQSRQQGEISIPLGYLFLPVANFYFHQNETDFWAQRLKRPLALIPVRSKLVFDPLKYRWIVPLTGSFSIQNI